MWCIGHSDCGTDHTLPPGPLHGSTIPAAENSFQGTQLAHTHMAAQCVSNSLAPRARSCQDTSNRCRGLGGVAELLPPDISCLQQLCLTMPVRDNALF